MAMNQRVKNPLILTTVSTVFLIPVLILTMFLFDDINWVIVVVSAVIYYIIMFLVFMYYGSLGKK